MVAIDDIGLEPAFALPEHRPESFASSSWPAWGVTATVTVTDPSALRSTRRLAMAQIAATEAAADGFRPNAEVHKLYRAGGRAITVSPLLADLISASLLTAERTGGDVDPTVNAAVTAARARAQARAQQSADPHLSLVPVCSAQAAPARPAPGFEQVHLHGRRLQVPAGTTLDLTATATAVAVDRAAARVADRLGVGVMVQLGGDVATAGPAPQDGWTVPVQGRRGEVQTLVTLQAGAALATSHLTSRPAAAHGSGSGPAGVPGVHLIDPKTGEPPAPVWLQASAIAFSSLEATAYTAATFVRGTTALAWLAQLWVPARLVTVDGDVITAGPWNQHVETIPTVPGPRLANPRRTTLR